MALSKDEYRGLVGRPGPEIVQSYTRRDVMLYALGLGIGADPMDETALRFVYEKELCTLPMMATVLGSAGLWVAAHGIDASRILHGEQRLEMIRPLPPEGTVVGRSGVRDVIDKGEARGALLYMTRELVDEATDEVLCRLESTTVARGDGGFGGPSGPTRNVHKVPERAPDVVVDYPTLPQQALIYRLSGDYNPLHAEPDFARAAGFERPILHGLCAYGMVGYVVVRQFCAGRAERLGALELRFTSPVYPGETLQIALWRDAGVVSFRARIAEREKIVLDNGRADIVT
jgi:acyl dehydratase